MTDMYLAINHLRRFWGSFPASCYQLCIPPKPNTKLGRGSEKTKPIEATEVKLLSINKIGGK